MIDSLSSAVLAWLLTYAIHSTVLLGLAWALTRARAWSPAASDLLWKTALVGGIVTATVQLRFDVRPAGSVSLRHETVTAPATQHPVAAVEAEPEITDAAGAVPKPPHPPASASAEYSAPSATAPAPTMTTHGLAVLGWALVAAVLALSYAGRRLILVGRIGDRVAVDDPTLLSELDRLASDAGLRHSPRLTSTVRISSPIALGVGEICVPETALTELDVEQQRSMLAHELAHLARRDPLWLAFASLIERVLWIQPLNRVARRRIATSAEFLCDEWAVRRTGSSVALARCLAQVAEWIQASPLGVPVAGMAEERSLLVSRVEKLLDGKAPVSRSRRLLAFGAGAAVLATIAIAPSVTGSAARATNLGADLDDPGRDEVAAPKPEEGQPTVADASARRAPVDTAIVVALIARLKDDDPGVRAAAAEALGKLEDPRAVPGLLGILNDREPKVRSAAAQSLGKFHDSRAINGLASLLRDSSPDVRKEALNALSEYESGIPVDAVIRLLDDPDAELRHAAAHTLGNQKDRSAGAALAKAVRDPSSDVRQAAIEALAELHDASHASAIAPALGDPNADVRQQALEALTELRAPIAEATLLGLMRDSNADVRGKAAEIAGERSVIGAIPSLRRLMDDADHDVREHAVSALSEIADPAADEALRMALNSKDPNVRRQAAEALGDRRQ